MNYVHGRKSYIYTYIASIDMNAPRKFRFASWKWKNICDASVHRMRVTPTLSITMRTRGKSQELFIPDVPQFYHAEYVVSKWKQRVAISRSNINFLTKLIIPTGRPFSPSTCPSLTCIITAKYQVGTTSLFISRNSWRSFRERDKSFRRGQIHTSRAINT